MTTFATASELAGQIRNRQTTVCAVVEEHVVRLRAVDAEYKTMVAFADDVLEKAQQADAELATGAAVGPLHGVPFTAKDWIQVAGLPAGTSFGHPLEHTPRRSATVISRLEAAGAILLGKSRADGGADTAPGPFNPHNKDHTCGGSSSGEAANVALGASAFGIGSDSGGSIRWPAHCCGVAGLKPSMGRVPLTGHVPPVIAMTDPRTVIGPLTRSVEDLRLILDVIQGADGRDASVLPIPAQPVPAIEGMRIAWFGGFSVSNPGPRARTSVDLATRALADAGAILENARPDRLDDSMAITKAYWSRPESASLAQFIPDGSSTLTADEVERSLFEWDRLRRDFYHFMQDYHAIICPVSVESAPLLRDALKTDYAYTVPFSLSGQPVVTIPVQRDDNGLPVGVQVVGRLYEEATAMAIAEIIESAAAFS